MLQNNHTMLWELVLTVFSILLKCQLKPILDHNRVGSLIYTPKCKYCLMSTPKNAFVKRHVSFTPHTDVIHLTSLDVQNESSQISSDADMLQQNKQDALDTLIRISQHKKPKKFNVARVVSEGNFLFLPYCILLVFAYIICLLSIIFFIV
jgi:hypothetical protein